MGYYKEDEFEQWLKDNNNRWTDPSSVSSYKSGVGSMIDWVNNNKQLWKTIGSTKFQEFECYLQNIANDKDRDTFFSAVLNIIQKEINNKPKNKGTLQNYKSYLCAYEDFFRDENFPQSTKFGTSQRNLLRKNSSCATYSKEELIDEFQGRILTQDRISRSKTILFPIRLIAQIWHNEALAWAKKVCNNIWIILQNEEKTKTIEKQITDIKILRIEKTGEVKVTMNDDENEYIMCTSYSDPYEYIKVENEIKYIKKRSEILSCDIPQNGTFKIDKNKNIRDSENKIILWHVKPVKIKSLGDIAIDHDIPISQVLIDKKNQLKTLLKISEEYCRLSQEYGLNVSAKEVNNFCKNFSSKGGKIKGVNNFPKDDMDLIGKCKLVLMGKDENSQKSDS